MVVEKGLGALLGIGVAKTALDNLSSVERDEVFMVALGKADLIEKLTPEQRAAYDYMVGQDQKGLITIFPKPDRELTGGKLVNPGHSGHQGIVNTGDNQPIGSGTTHTGNSDGLANTGGNQIPEPIEKLPGTPIPETPSLDDLAYLDKITQGEHAGIRNKEGRPVGSVINDVQKSRPTDILIQDDGRWVVKGNGGRIHIIEPDGEVVTSFDNPANNTNRRIKDGTWNRPSNEQLNEFKDKFSDCVRW